MSIWQVSHQLNFRFKRSRLFSVGLESGNLDNRRRHLICLLLQQFWLDGNVRVLCRLGRLVIWFGDIDPSFSRFLVDICCLKELHVLRHTCITEIIFSNSFCRLSVFKQYIHFRGLLRFLSFWQCSVTDLDRPSSENIGDLSRSVFSSTEHVFPRYNEQLWRQKIAQLLHGIDRFIWHGEQLCTLYYDGPFCRSSVWLIVVQAECIEGKPFIVFLFLRMETPVDFSIATGFRWCCKPSYWADPHS